MVIRSAMPLPPVDSLGRGPASDRNGLVFHATRAIRLAVGERMREKTVVIARREVGALMRAAGLAPRTYRYAP